MEQPMRMVRLRNGNVAPHAMITVISAVLQKLYSGDDNISGALAFYDLVSRCRDSSYQFFGDNEAKLTALNFVQNGHIHEQIRDIVLSSAEGDGIDMRLVSPIR